LKSGGHPEEDSKFDVEFLFLESGVEHWLPVQSNVVPYLVKEVGKGESVHLLALWIGRTYPENGERHHVVIVNEFCKPQQNQSTPRVAAASPKNKPELSRDSISPFEARYVGGDRVPEVQVNNNADVTLKLAIGQSRYVIKPLTTQTITLIASWRS